MAALFTCEVAYYGARQVLGAQSSSSLNALVDDLLRPNGQMHAQTPNTTPSGVSARPIQHLHNNYGKGIRGERCQLVCDEEAVRLAPIRKDEGFESDTESSSSSACDDPCCPAMDVKVMSDHVLRLDQLITRVDGPSSSTSTNTTSSTTPDDASSSASTSSGAESEDDSTSSSNNNKGHPTHQVCGSVGVGGVGVGGDGGCVSIVAVSDVLYCHVSPSWPRVVVMVATAGPGGGGVWGHVFQCLTQDAARALYAHYKEVASRYRLSRYRGSRRRVVGSGSGSGARGSVRVVTSHAPDSNVQVIQIREGDGMGGGGGRGGLVTHIHIDSGPASLINPSSGPPSLTLPMPGPAPSRPARHTREVLVAGLGAGPAVDDRKFRQRQQPNLLTHQEGAVWNYDSLRRDQRRDRRDENVVGLGAGPVGGRSRRDWHDGERSERSSLVHDGYRGGQQDAAPERPPRPRDASRGRARSQHKKGPAPPPPPPRRHPSQPGVVLVPTKSGAESARSFYPKESHLRGNKVVVAWGPDLNNNPRQYTYLGQGAWRGPHEYHALPPRQATITPEMRRRSRSKSPARRPAASRYMDAVSTFSISQKLKDFSDAVFTARRNTSNHQGGINSGGTMTMPRGGGGEVRGHQRSPSTVSAPPGDGEGGTLRPVIKKGRRVEGSPQPRRVTFSAYATVQVMEG